MRIRGGKVCATLALLAACLVAAACISPAQSQEPPRPRVEVVTNAGSFQVELWPDVAPRTVTNFVRYVRKGHYNGTIFHRVVKGMLIQGGAFNADLEARPTQPPIPLEAAAPNRRYTIAMARLSDPDSATCQFFINLDNNRTLDQAGYAVFGKVVSGTPIVEQIARVQVRREGPGLENLPVTPVVIERIALVPSAPAGQAKP